MNSEQLNNLSKHISSPVPFWFLNGPVEEWHIVREFEMMAGKDIHDVIVHPRYGLQCEYLSDEWFEIFGWCVREAKKHGMHVWMYDELNWPSGTAGMTVTANPEFQGKYLSVNAEPLEETDLVSFQPGDYLIAANIEGESITKTKVLEDVAALRALTGKWTIFNCTVKRDPFYIDTLSFAAVSRFKEVTYDEYYKRFGDEFGKAIRCMFTDEPSIYWVSVGYDDWNLPYTGDFFSTFEANYNYSPVQMIPHLFHPGAKGTAFRADYWEHAGFLFNERYHGQLGSWCREHGVIYTGHNNHEEPLRYQIRFQGDMFGTMRAMDIPGVDHLQKATLGNRWISIIGHKICSSETHFDGKARCMSESFGVMDWDTTYENLKRVTDWQFALGINLLIPHAVYHTIGGMTKRESPPSFFYQSPHWQDFDYFSEYVKQLESMLCGGRHLCKVAVLYPTSGLWASYESDRKTPEFDHTDNFLNSLCLELIKAQIDFDLVDYPALVDARLEDSKMKLADEAYEVLIVPATPYMRPNEIARLTEIVKSGINVTLFHKAMEPLRENLPDGMRGAAFVRSEELESYVEILKKGLDEDIQIQGGGAEDIMAYRREKDGHKVTFLLNRSEKHRKVSALIKDYPDAALFDQETGVFTKLEGRQAGKKTLVQLRFQPNQSYFIVSGVPDAPRHPELGSGPRMMNPVQHDVGEATPIALKNLQVSVPFNVASIYHFNYTPPLTKGTIDVRPLAKGGPGGVETRRIDVRTHPRYMPVQWTADKPDFEAFAGDYEATITLDFDPASETAIQMMVDKDFAECEVYVNGTKVDLQPAPEVARDSFLTDFSDVSAFVGHLLKRGKNVLKVASPTKLSEPLRLVGDFRVELSGEDLTLHTPAEPKPFNLEIDYPFYSGTVTYQAEFELDGKPDSLTLNLHDVRDAAEVWVNGRNAGKRLWQPYVFEIADLADPGMNTLTIEVRNNMANLILGNPRPLGLRQMPTLAAY